MRYSTLDQIKRENVTELQPAWTYRTDDSTADSTIDCTPIVIDGEWEKGAEKGTKYCPGYAFLTPPGGRDSGR